MADEPEMLATKIVITERPTRGALSPVASFAAVLVSLFLFLAGISSRAQTSSGSVSTAGADATPQQSQIMSTGAAASPVFDSEKRAITAGGFVKSGPVIFHNTAKSAGLNQWKNVTGTPSKKFLLETIGCGVALLDYDNDGWLDIYLVNGSTFQALDGKAAAPQAALFHNNHDGTFTDVAEKAGVTNDRWGVGAVVGDYDNDGWPDIYVTNYGRNRLYHNNHDGTFTDVAAKAGVALGGWSTGATFGDYDGDGFLDLFVPGYVHWDRAGSAANRASAGCQYRNMQVACGPRGMQGERDHLFHNNGDGTFTDVSQKAGVGDSNRYYGLSSLFVRLSRSPRLDLVVANDSTPNYLYINQRNGRFTDNSYASGYAFNQDGRETASMGIAAGDYANNGRIDLFNTTFSDDYDVLYRNDGDANFMDVSAAAGIADATVPFLGWGDGFFDYDNDGWKDLLIANGHVYPMVDAHDWGMTYAQRPLLFHNLQSGKFALIPAVENTGLAVVIPARGMAFGDLFNDGKIDAVINNIDDVPTLLRNVSADHNHWVEIQLIGAGKSPRDAVGATVYLTSNGVRQREDVLSGGSFASSNDQRLHFGLGAALAPLPIEIDWPDQKVERMQLPAVDTIFAIEEGKGIVKRLSK
jgi:hypothetical protein